MDPQELKSRLTRNALWASLLVGFTLNVILNAPHLPMIWGAIPFAWSEFGRILIPFLVPFMVGMLCRNNLFPVYSAILNLKNPFFLLDRHGKVRLVSNRLLGELNEMSLGNGGKVYSLCNLQALDFEKLMEKFGFGASELKEICDRYQKNKEITAAEQVLGQKIQGRRYGFICSSNPMVQGKFSHPAQATFIRKDDLTQKDQSAVMVLAKAAESKDKDTGNHILRMRNHCQVLGAELGLSEDDLEILDYGSILHDVGKIAIEDRILNKPGKLDVEEWEIMKTHAAKGGEILRKGGDPLLFRVAVIPEQHHENFDGTGYPAGLKGEEISLLARIVAVVDTFDALSSKRPYKEKFSIDRVHLELEALRGKKLDGKILDIFYDCLKRSRPEWQNLILSKNKEPIVAEELVQTAFFEA